MPTLILLNIARFAPALQEAEQTALRWTYVWLGLCGLVLALSLFAFAYLLARRGWDRLAELVRHPVLHRLDQFLLDRIPQVWALVRRRFSIDAWHGLALTAAAGVVFAAGYLFLSITESWVDEEALYSVDRGVYAWLMESVNEPVVAFMQAVTRFGDALVVLVLSLLTGALLLWRRRYWQVVALFITMGAGSAFMQGLKLVFSRSRPEIQAYEVTGHSFPSGHAFAAVTFFGFLIYLTWQFVRRDGLRIGATIVLTLLIVMIGLSRVILRVHWVSDVAGGLSIGLAWLVCSLIISRALRAFYSSEPSSEGSVDPPPSSPGPAWRRAEFHDH